MKEAKKMRSNKQDVLTNIKIIVSLLKYRKLQTCSKESP